jgi:HTH-type transcriptional regulator, sugar sensing transcriptional regulator
MELGDILQEIGLTHSETAVYIALLELGSTTTGPIIKKAQIPQGKVYVILDKLINKGIITYTIKEGVKHFQAKDPHAILAWYERAEKDFMDKKDKLLKMMPLLKAKHKESSYDKQVEIYEGFNALKILYDSLLDIDKELMTIGNTPKIPEQLEGFLLGWHKSRIGRNIPSRFIYGTERRLQAKNREKMKYTQVRYLDLPVSPTWTTVVDDYVITVSFTELKNLTCFLIKDKNIADAQKSYFEILWKQAQKLGQ